MNDRSGYSTRGLFENLPGRGLAWVLPACVGLMLGAADTPRAPRPEVWTFDRLDRIGGHPTTVLGHPRVIQTPLGKAVEFNGVDDALFVDVHPLVGAETFTWEVIFRPDRDGSPEQRFFHLQERDPKTGSDTATRLLFEIRVVGDRWCLDSFALSGDAVVTVRILNAAGRAVRALWAAQQCAAGINSLTWSGQADTGLRVPNGLYLVEVTAHAGDGTVARAVTGVRVTR